MASNIKFDNKLLLILFSIYEPCQTTTLPNYFATQKEKNANFILRFRWVFVMFDNQTNKYDS